MGDDRTSVSYCLYKVSTMIITAVERDVQADAVRAVIETVGRPITFVTSSGIIACPTCSGFDAFCGVCGGAGTTKETHQHVLVAAVRWRTGEVPRYRPGGAIIDGDCLVTIAYSGVYLPMLDAAYTVLVDDTPCVIKEYHVRGMSPNRITVTLLQDST